MSVGKQNGVAMDPTHSEEQDAVAVQNPHQMACRVPWTRKCVIRREEKHRKFKGRLKGRSL